MKAIYEAVDRFCARHPRFGIPNLMRYVVIGNVIVYVLMMFTQANDANALSFLTFYWPAVLKGEIWRIATFVLVPQDSSIIFLAISLYFYYWIGSVLENKWGTARFNLYYFGGMVATIIGAVLAGLVQGAHFNVAGATYVNLSMFLAFACLFPDTQVMLFFVIPVKMKWLAYLDAALFGFEIINSIRLGLWSGVVLPVVALLNFAVFIWPEVTYLKEKAAYRRSPQVVQFKKAVKQQQQQRGYTHKCAVCGRTDADYPDLQFRYCSKCAGYHCFCQDHIFSHVHFEE